MRIEQREIGEAKAYPERLQIVATKPRGSEAKDAVYRQLAVPSAPVWITDAGGASIREIERPQRADGRGEREGLVTGARAPWH